MSSEGGQAGKEDEEVRVGKGMRKAECVCEREGGRGRETNLEEKKKKSPCVK